MLGTLVRLILTLDLVVCCFAVVSGCGRVPDVDLRMLCRALEPDSGRVGPNCLDIPDDVLRIDTRSSVEFFLVSALDNKDGRPLDEERFICSSLESLREAIGSLLLLVDRVIEPLLRSRVDVSGRLLLRRSVCL